MHAWRSYVAPRLVANLSGAIGRFYRASYQPSSEYSLSLSLFALLRTITHADANKIMRYHVRESW